MQPQSPILDHQFVALRREFVFKVDGNRPILYPLDYINTQIHFLKPLEGFALSLLSGDRPFSQVREIFARLFPESSPDTLPRLLMDVDSVVRQNPSQVGFGSQGLFEISDAPITAARKYDPRQFVIAPDRYWARMDDVKTRYRLDTPIDIYTIFTHRCVTNCAYCYAERLHMREMPLARWREIVQEAEDLGIEMCSPDNGDTFARQDGIDFLECLIEHNMHFLLSTKAHLSRAEIQRLVSAGFTRRLHGVVERPVQLSIDAADEEVAKRVLRVSRPGVAKMVETFENWMAFGVMPKIKAVITGLNYDQPLKLVDLLYPRGARTFIFVRYRRSFHRHSDILFVEREYVPILKDQFDKIRERYPDVDLHEDLTTGWDDSGQLTPERRQELWNQRIGCGGGYYALGVAPDGSAFLCEQMTLDQPYLVGNASTQSLMDIWRSERLAHFIYPEREQFAGTVCAECAEFESCMWEKGRCYRDAYFSYGSIYEPPPLCPAHDRPGLRLT